MKNFTLTFVLAIGFCFSALSQDDSRKQNVYYELGGTSLIHSLNYDFLLKKGKNNGFAVRVGLGRVQAGVNLDQVIEDVDFEAGVWTFPMGINYLAGSKRSFLEIGAGVTPLVYYANMNFDDGIQARVSKKTAMGSLNLGYRFQPINKGVIFRINYTPIFDADSFNHFGGLSIGYSF